MNPITENINGKIIIRVAYEPSFVVALKAQIPAADRKWNADAKVWEVSEHHARLIDSLIAQHIDVFAEEQFRIEAELNDAELDKYEARRTELLTRCVNFASGNTHKGATIARYIEEDYEISAAQFSSPKLFAEFTAVRNWWAGIEETPAEIVTESAIMDAAAIGATQDDYWAGILAEYDDEHGDNIRALKKFSGAAVPVLDKPAIDVALIDLQGAVKGVELSPARKTEIEALVLANGTIYSVWCIAYKAGLKAGRNQAVSHWE